MSAQDYDKRITIERKVDPPTRTASKAVVRQWEPFAVRWARVAAGGLRGGREYVAAKQVNAETDAVWIIRAPLAVTPLMRVVHQGHYYDILEVDFLSDKSEVRLICREGKSAQ